MPTLELLTWNIWMMPAWSRQSPRNCERAEAVAEVLRTRPVDVLCLQKAFDRRARAIIGPALHDLYPHQFGPLNEEGSPLEVNGGVWVLSKHPLTHRKEIQFEASAGVETFSRKGAMFLAGEIEGQGFEIVATHLQGDDRPTFNPPHQLVRDAQALEIGRAAEAWSHRALPAFFCGDFSTPRHAEAPPHGESAGYRKLLDALDVTNGADTRITLDDRRSHNDLAEGDTGRRAEMDYLLVREGTGCTVRGTRERVIFRRGGWDGHKGRQDLSYRYAVAGTFELTSKPA